MVSETISDDRLVCMVTNPCNTKTINDLAISLFNAREQIKLFVIDQKIQSSFLESACDDVEKLRIQLNEKNIELERIQKGYWSQKHKAKRWWQLFRKRGRVIEVLQKKRCNA